MSISASNIFDLTAKGKLVADKISQLNLYPLAVRVALFLAFFGNTIDLEDAQNPTVNINAQAIAKAGMVLVAVGLGFIGLLRLVSVRLLLHSPVGFVSILLGLLYFIATITSINPKVSSVGAMAYVGYLLLLLTAMGLFGPKRIMQDAAIAVFCFLVAVWFSYLFVPEIGVYMEPAGTGFVARMSGLGHPNALGRSASLLVIFVVAGYRMGHYRLWLTLLVVLFGVVSIRESLSRTAMLACFISLLVSNRDLLRSRFFLICLGPAVLAGLAAMFYIDQRYGFDRAVNKVMVGTSKTGDAEEITSATGRTRIWAKSWQLILQKPYLGHGSGTSPMLLKDYSYHTHNILLNPMLSFGMLGGVFVLVWLIVNLIQAFTTKVCAITAILVFLIISGLTENTILGTYPEVCTLSWFLASFWPYVDGVNLRLAEMRSQANAAVASNV